MAEVTGDPITTISVRSIERLANDLVAVSLRLGDNTLRRFIMRSDMATFDNVTFTAAAVAQLVTIQELRR